MLGRTICVLLFGKQKQTGAIELDAAALTKVVEITSAQWRIAMDFANQQKNDYARRACRSAYCLPDTDESTDSDTKQEADHFA